MHFFISFSRAQLALLSLSSSPQKVPFLEACRLARAADFPEVSGLRTREPARKGIIEFLDLLDRFSEEAEFKTPAEMIR